MDEDEMTQEEIKQDIDKLEKQYGITSEQLLEMKKNGTVPDAFDFGLWLQLLNYLDKSEG